MRRALLSVALLSLAGVTASIIAGCSEGSPSDADPADAGSSSSDGGTSSVDGGPDGASNGEDNDPFPGDPPNAAAAVRVKINGVERSFNGPATWTKFNIDGGPVEGFQTNARSANGWMLLLAVRETALGTYTCEVDSSGGLSLSQDDDDGSSRTIFGGQVGRQTCTIDLATHGSRKGDLVSGTFSGELELTKGDYPVQTLVFTEGTFELVQFADTP